METRSDSRQKLVGGVKCQRNGIQGPQSRARGVGKRCSDLLRPGFTGENHTARAALPFVCYFHSLQKEKTRASGRGCFSGELQPCGQSKTVWTALAKCLIAFMGLVRQDFQML